MKKDQEVLTSTVKRTVDNGTMDELVVAVLEDNLEANFMELEKLCQRKYLEAHHWQDYTDCLQFSHACIKVLRYFSGKYYTGAQMKANEYSLKIQEVF